MPPSATADPGFMANFVFYRILGGIGVGLASMLSPMYIAEIAPPKVRGNLVAWNQFAIIFGMLVIYFVNFGISKTGSGDAWLNSIGWRYMFLSGAIPAILFLILLFFVPETPRYLMLKGNESGARAVLAKLVTPEEGEKDVSEIRASLSEHHSGKFFSFGVLLIFIGIMLSVFQQFVGINVVLYYATDIFKGMGLTTNASLFQTIVVGAVNLAFTVVAILSVDRFGRKPLQIIGALVMAVSMISLGTDFWLGGKGMVALVCMLVYTAGFAVSWGPVTWVLLSEIFPNQIRGKAMAVAVAAQWIANYLVSWTFPILDKNPYLIEPFQAWLRLLDLRRHVHPRRLLHVESCARNQGPFPGADGSRLAGVRRKILVAKPLAGAPRLIPRIIMLRVPPVPRPPRRRDRGDRGPQSAGRRPRSSRIDPAKRPPGIVTRPSDRHHCA